MWRLSAERPDSHVTHYAEVHCMLQYSGMTPDANSSMYVWFLLLWRWPAPSDVWRA
jgi:hypothetical protein